ARTWPALRGTSHTDTSVRPNNWKTIRKSSVYALKATSTSCLKIGVTAPFRTPKPRFQSRLVSFAAGLCRPSGGSGVTQRHRRHDYMHTFRHLVTFAPNS